MALIKCKECGKEISDNAVNCPHCGCPLKPKKKTTYVLVMAIIGLILSISKVGVLLCAVSVILSVLNLKKNKKVKDIISMIIGICGIIFFLAFNILNSDAVRYASGKEYIDIKGVFNLNPHNNKSIIDNNLGENQSYVIVVYDLKNDTNKNEEIDVFADAGRLLFGDKNMYEQLDSHSYDNKMYTEFIKGCGYKVSTDIRTLPGGTSSPIRMIATFVINNNDLIEFDNAILKLNLSGNINAKETIKTNEIVNISTFDDIFSVEDNPKEYQVAYSVYSRAMYTRKMVDQCISQTKKRNLSAAKLSLIMARDIFTKEVGVSVAVSSDYGVYIGDEYPAYNDEAIKNVFPDIWGKVEKIKEELDRSIDLYEKLETNATQDTLNAFNKSIETIRNMTERIEEYFEE